MVLLAQLHYDATMPILLAIRLNALSLAACYQADSLVWNLGDSYELICRPQNLVDFIPDCQQSILVASIPHSANIIPSSNHPSRRQDHRVLLLHHSSWFTWFENSNCRGMATIHQFVSPSSDEIEGSQDANHPNPVVSDSLGWIWSLQVSRQSFSNTGRQLLLGRNRQDGGTKKTI